MSPAEKEKEKERLAAIINSMVVFFHVVRIPGKNWSDDFSF